MAKPKENTERINVFLTKEICDKLRAEADIKGMTMSGMVRMIVLEYFRNKQ